LNNPNRRFATRQTEALAYLTQRDANLISAGTGAHATVCAEALIAGPSLVLPLVVPVQAVRARVAVLTASDRIRVIAIAREAAYGHRSTRSVHARVAPRYAACSAKQRGTAARAAVTFRGAHAVAGQARTAGLWDCRFPAVEGTGIHCAGLRYAGIGEACVERPCVEKPTSIGPSL
jgi:hypothetical protein